MSKAWRSMGSQGEEDKKKKKKKRYLSVGFDVRKRTSHIRWFVLPVRDCILREDSPAIVGVCRESTCLYERL